MIRRKLLQWAGAAWRALGLPPIGENNGVAERVDEHTEPQKRT